MVHHNGRVLLMRESARYEDGTAEGKWDVPGGRIEPEEEVRQGLVREVKEESGLDVVPGDLMGVFDGFPSIQGEDCHVVRLYFLCDSPSDAVVLSADHDAYEWIDPGNIGDKVLVADIAEMLDAFREMNINR